MTGKPFSADLYAENNQLAITAASEMLTYRGYEVIYPEREMYKDYDFTFKVPGGEQYNIEVERKKGWKKSGLWQGWSTVDIPYRKKDSKADYFCMLNYSCDTLLIIHMGKVLNSRVKVKDTIYTKGEKFFTVDASEFTLLSKQGEVWK